MALDIYQTVTDNIVKAIETGAASGTWRMPWHTTSAQRRPFNVVSRKAYRGVNVLALWGASHAAGYSNGVWATYKQWQDLGAQVRKGERATSIVFWKELTFAEKSGKGESDSDDAKTYRRMMARGYSVFNAAQVDGWSLPVNDVPRLADGARIAAAEEYLAVGANVQHGGDRAYYRPSTDTIQMPPFETFRDALGYYATLAHELTHWTGAKSRLDRQTGKRFGDDAYAAEELIAELGAAFACAACGISLEPRADHAVYIASWLKRLKADNRAIFTAAGQAQIAVDYLEKAAADRAAVSLAA